MFKNLLHYSDELDSLSESDYASQQPAIAKDSYCFWAISLTMLTLCAMSLRLLTL